MKSWDEYLDFAQGGRQLVNKVDDAFVVVNLDIRRLLMEVKKGGKESSDLGVRESRQFASLLCGRHGEGKGQEGVSAQQSAVPPTRPT